MVVFLVFELMVFLQWFLSLFFGDRWFYTVLLFFLRD